MTKEKKLTLKQEKFIAEYLKTGNGTQSAKDAGYSENCAQEIASENLSKSIIKERIQSAAEKLGITTDYVLRNFKEISDYNREKVIRLKSKGSQDASGETEDIIVEQMRDVNAAIKSNELLGKHLKLFTETVELEVKEVPNEERQMELAKKMAFILSRASSK